MRKPFVIFLVLWLYAMGATAQCPSSTDPSVHIVQPGENLYRISLKYKVSIDDLCAWNNIKKEALLPTCKRLSVKTPASYGDTLSPKSGEKAYLRQTGNRHTVRAGETAAGLAHLYGYAEWRFRKINGLKDSDKIVPGMVLISDHCNKTAYQPSTNLPTPDPIPKAYQALRPDSSLSPDVQTAKSPSTPNNAAAQAPYMKQQEWNMVEEINLLRKNPAGYVKYVEEYRDSKRAKMLGVDHSAVNELIEELKGTPQLPALKTTECLQSAAKQHGQEIKIKGAYDHKGKNDTWPWDRVRDACTEFQDGNENFVAVPGDTRQTIITLLIDQGISGRGHRRALLNPHWTHIACYKIGTVGTSPNAWLQKFGQE